MTKRIFRGLFVLAGIIVTWALLFLRFFHRRSVAPSPAGAMGD